MKLVYGFLIILLLLGAGTFVFLKYGHPQTKKVSKEFVPLALETPVSTATSTTGAAGETLAKKYLSLSRDKKGFHRKTPVRLTLPVSTDQRYRAT